MAMKISLGSGATLATNLVNGEHMQIISGVSLYPSANFIGLVTTVPGAVQPVSDNGGTITVDWTSGATVAVSNIPNVTVGSALPAGTNYIGLASVNVGNTINALATITTSGAIPVTDNAGSLTVDGTVGVSGLISLASGTFISLNTGTNTIGKLAANTGVDIGDVDVTSIAAGDNNIGNVDLASEIPTGTKFIGLVTAYPGAAFPVTDNSQSLTVDGTVATTQSGTWTVQPGNSANTTPWLVTQTNGLISLASGTFVSLNQGTNHVGSVTIFGNLNATLGMTTLFPGPNFIGLVTTVMGSEIPAGTKHIGSVSIFGTVQSTPGMTTLFPGPNFIGLVTTVMGTEIPAGTKHIGSVSIFGNINTTTGMTTLFPGPNQIGSVTVSNTVAVSQNGTWTVQPGNTANSTPWLVTQSGGLISLASGTFVSLNAGTNHVGSVTIFGNLNTTTGMTTLFPGPNFIGLVTTVPGAVQPVNDNGGSLTVDGTVSANQSGTWTVQPGNTANSTPWLVTQTNGLISLASGTFVSLNAGTNAIGKLAPNSGVDIGDVDILSIAAGDNNIGNVDIASEIPVGTKYIGLVTAYPGAAFPVTDNAGSLTVDGTVAATKSGTWTLDANSGVDIGDVTLTAGTNYVGLASVNIGGTLPALTAGTNFIGLVSVQGNVNIQSGATVTPTYISTYTSLATVISATGNATLFVPPSSQRWILKDLQITSLGRSEVQVLSGTNVIIPYAALATTGGYVQNFGDSGLRGKAVNESFVVALNGAATISVLANVRFE